MIKLINSKFEDVSQNDIGTVDLIIADIPDNIGQQYPGYKDKIPVPEYYAAVRTWVCKMKSLTDGPIFLLFNEKWTGIIEDILRDSGVCIVQRLLWYYKFGMDQSKHNKYSLCYRPIYWLNSDFMIPENIKIPSARQTKYHDKRAATGGKIPSNVFEFPRICGTFKEKRKWFPNQINQEIVERIMLGHCNQDGIILDPFVGSGTSVYAAIRTGRNCIGIDISQTCIAAIKETLIS